MWYCLISHAHRSGFAARDLQDRFIEDRDRFHSAANCLLLMVSTQPGAPPLTVKSSFTDPGRNLQPI